jgi:DNA mismatch repair protein MutL
MLFPQNIELNISDFKLVMELEEEIRALGFIFEIFGKSNLKINGIPSDLLPGKEKELFEGLVEQFKVNKSELTIPIRENLARSLAKRSAIKTGHRLDREEMNILIDKLFGCSNPNYAPDGRSTFCIFDLNKIANYFK